MGSKKCSLLLLVFSFHVPVHLHPVLESLVAGFTGEHFAFNAFLLVFLQMVWALGFVLTLLT